MKKRLLSILLIVCLCAALLPTFAAADTSAIEGKGTEAEPWILTQEVFESAVQFGEPVDKKTVFDLYSGKSEVCYYLKDGYYKLRDDVTIGESDCICIIHTVTLDLNGNKIEKNGTDRNAILIMEKTSTVYLTGNLTLNDSKGNGTISGYIEVYYATFTMNGGSIRGNVIVREKAKFNMMGGDCKGKIQKKGGKITGVFPADVENNASYEKNNIPIPGGGSIPHIEDIESKIDGGVFYGSVTNMRTPPDADQSRAAKIRGGVFYGEVKNYGEITGGVFLGEITGDGKIIGDQHNITIDLGDGEAAKNGIVVGNKLYPMEEPTKDGFRFTGWFDEDGNPWDFETSEIPEGTEKLTLTAGWEEIPDENPDEQPDENPDGVGGLVAILDDVPFVDVDFNDYYYDSVKWAYHSGVTGGTDAWHFSPDAGCTRAQAVTFLWRAAGCPTAAYLGNFTDVDADAYYAPAVAWAVANGVTNGTSATTFSPEAACSRGDIVTFLYRAFGGTSNGYHPFGDVNANAYYADAVAWAYEHNVTGGTSADKFSPAEACTRAQIVTFLYRVLG